MYYVRVNWFWLNALMEVDNQVGRVFVALIHNSELGGGERKKRQLDFFPFIYRTDDFQAILPLLRHIQQLHANFNHFWLFSVTAGHL